MSLHDLHADYLHFLLLRYLIRLLTVLEPLLRVSLDVDHRDQTGLQAGRYFQLYLVLPDDLAFIRCLF